MSFVPRAAEFPSGATSVISCDNNLTSLCVNRQANIFTPLHGISLAFSCQELTIPIYCHSTQSCVHSHAAGAGNTWASLWH